MLGTNRWKLIGQVCTMHIATESWSWNKPTFSISIPSRAYESKPLPDMSAYVASSNPAYSLPQIVRLHWKVEIPISSGINYPTSSSILWNSTSFIIPH